MLHLVAVVLLAVLGASAASAQERGWLAIGLESARHAFSFSGSADAVNACGMSDCEVVETFTACLSVAYSSATASGRPVWTWSEAATEGDARQGAQTECEAAGGLRCAVENTYCLDGAGPAAQQATPPATAEQENIFWQSIMNSTNPADFEAYLAQFPNGVFRSLAENRLAALREGPDGPAAGGGPRVGSTANAPADAGHPTADWSIDFGDDSGEFAREGECDDPRFEGDGMSLPSGVFGERGRDAADCRQLHDEGRIRLSGVDLDSGVIDFGDDTGDRALNGECNDPRFDGGGTDAFTHPYDRGHDATDCRALYDAGRIHLFGVNVATVR